MELISDLYNITLLIWNQWLEQLEIKAESQYFHLTVIVTLIQFQVIQCAGTKTKLLILKALCLTSRSTKYNAEEPLLFLVPDNS